MNINIRLAKDALQFQHRQLPVYEQISSRFHQKLKEKFTAILEQLQKEDEELYRMGETRLKKIGGIESLSNVWDAPELVKKVLDYPYETAGEIYSFLLKAAEAEAAKKAGAFDATAYPYLWSASGDYLIQFSEDTETFHEYHAFQLNDSIVLDFFSPGCIRIDNKELGEDPSEPIEEYDYEEAFSLYEKLEESLNPLSGFSGSVTDLVTHYTKVVVLKKQAQKRSFSSASNFPYIGLSVLVNADKASFSQIIDALVHESTHSMLYMIDVIEKWMPLNATIHRVGRNIVSPWTGRALNPGNFCQAIFVWYGLFNFWQYALDKNIYDKEYGEQRLATIQKGFEQVEIDLLNRKFDLQLNDTLLETVTSVKETVLAQPCKAAGSY